MKSIGKKLFSLVLALMLVFAMGLTAFAHEPVDLDRSGSITVSVQYDGKGVAKAKFTCIRMAYVQEIKGTESGFYFFRTLDGEMIGNELVSEDAAALAEELEKLWLDNQETFEFAEWTKETDENGKVTFTGLEPGLYLIRQPSATYGYSKMAAFLVSVPYVVKDSEDSWHYEYNVTAAAKSELEREPVPTAPPPEKLPQTGQLQWPIPILAVAGMAFLAAGWMMKRREKHYDR